MKNKETIFFRVDGDNGQKAGLGHVCRTLKIYKFLKSMFQKKYNYIFLMKNYELGRKIIHEKTKEKIITYSKFINKEIFNEKDIVIIDTLGAEKFFLKILEIKKVKKIINFDELNLKIFKRGIIINGIYFAKKRLTTSSKKISIFQGPEYLVLNEQFYKEKKRLEINNKINVLISSGGADNKNFLFKICNLLNLHKKLNFNTRIVVGEGVKKDNPIHAYGKENKIKIYKNVKNMKKILDNTHVAIVSGGTVMFESICSGTTTFVCATYPHQNFAIKYFKKKKIINDIGSINYIKPIILKKYFESPLQIQKNYKKFFLKRIQEVDGRGLLRVRKIICEYINDSKY